MIKETAARQAAFEASAAGTPVVVADESEKPTIEQAIEGAKTALLESEALLNKAKAAQDLPNNDGAEEESSEPEKNSPEATLEESIADEVDLTAQDDAELEAEKQKVEMLKVEMLKERNDEIKVLCEAANLSNLSKVFISADMSIDLVREELLLLTETNNESNDIVTSTSVTLTNIDDKSSIKDSWADAFDKV